MIKCIVWSDEFETHSLFEFIVVYRCVENPSYRTEGILSM